MTPTAVLACLAAQTEPAKLPAIGAHFGIDVFHPRASTLECILLRLIDDGARVCEPLGEFKGYAITDAGREELKRLQTPVPKKREQMSMF
jgi:DNA-binding PadR family transcriptional regulator